MHFTVVLLLWQWCHARKRELEQLHHQCRQISQEASNLLHQLKEVVRSCHYPQLVPQVTSSRVQEAQEMAQAVSQGCAEQDASDEPQAAEVCFVSCFYRTLVRFECAFKSYDFCESIVP